MKYFKKVTIGDGNNAVIMGRKTFDCIGRILPNRLNIVLTSRKQVAQKKMYSTALLWRMQCNSVQKKMSGTFFVIGGRDIYSLLFEKYSHNIGTIYFTYIHRDYNGSIYLPSFKWDNFYLYSSCMDEQDDCVEYLIYKNQENVLDEYQYLNLVKATLSEPDLCSFGTMMKFNLKKDFHY